MPAHMLFGLIVLLAAATPGQPVSAEDPTTDLRLLVAATAGASFFQSTAAPRALVLSARAGLVALVPPLASGGSRLGLGVTLFGRRDFGLRATDWGGGGLCSIELWRLLLSASLGAGLTTVDGLGPQPLLDLSMNVGLRVGAWVFGVGVEGQLRPVDDLRALQVVGTVTWAPLLRRE